MNILVLGIGNLLLADEGVGVHVAQGLISKGYPPQVTVLEVGTAILDALPALESADKVILVDAVKGDHPPGTIYRMPLEECASSPTIASMHGFDLRRVMALTERRSSPPVIVIGVEPAVIDWSMDLSEPVGKALPVVLNLIEQEWGILPTTKAG